MWPPLFTLSVSFLPRATSVNHSSVRTRIHESGLTRRNLEVKGQLLTSISMKGASYCSSPAESTFIDSRATHSPLEVQASLCQPPRYPTACWGRVLRKPKSSETMPSVVQGSERIALPLEMCLRALADVVAVRFN